jgi:hypothetical protein
MLTAARLAYCRDHNGNLRDISGRFAGTRSNVAELTGPGVRAPRRGRRGGKKVRASRIRAVCALQRSPSNSGGIYEKRLSRMTIRITQRARRPG